MNRKSSKKPWLAIVLFISPLMIYYALFILYPLFVTIFNSFMRITPNGNGLTTSFIGLTNFVDLLGDAIFVKSVYNTLLWAVVGPVLEIVVATGLALVIYYKAPFAKFYRTAWFAPMLVTGVIVGLIFKWIFNMDWGLANALLRAIGLGSLEVNWLGNMTTPIWIVIFVHFWNTFGYSFVIILAGLSAVPNDIVESAALDGASKLKTAFYILVPTIFPILSTAFMLSFLGKMRAFHVVWVLTQGGPLHASETVATYIQKRAFEWGSMDLGYPSAIAVFWFVIVLVGVNVISRWSQKRMDKWA